MKPDELVLLKEAFKQHGGAAYRDVDHKPPFFDEIAQGFGICDKRSYYILTKWDDKGWWDSGVSLRSGWFTPEGVVAIKEILARAQDDSLIKENSSSIPKSQSTKGESK